jgi:hypothetical protein
MLLSLEPLILSCHLLAKICRKRGGKSPSGVAEITFFSSSPLTGEAVDGDEL